MSDNRFEEVLGWLAEAGLEIERRAATSATASDPDGQVVLTDLGAWVMVTVHLVPRPLFEAPKIHPLIAETGMRVNDRPLGGCRLATDPHGLLLIHDIDPDAGADGVTRAVWMMGELAPGLLRLFDEVIERCVAPTDERIDAALEPDDEAEEAGWIN